MNWTKEEIKNSRGIAKYFRKEIKKGDWFAVKGENFTKNAPNFFKRMGIQLIEIDNEKHTINLRSEQFPLTPRQQTEDWDCFPLWTLTNCLEFLEEKGVYRIELWNRARKPFWLCRWGNLDKWTKASTPTASAQLAVLEILKGDKDE